VVELVDTLVLGTSAYACGFESHLGYKLKKQINMKKFIKWTPVAIALAALFYSVGLGMNGHTDEALYSSHWPVTLLVFYLVIDKINKE
jgi:hypothetical protein